jgi:hypothetical protein
MYHTFFRNRGGEIYETTYLRKHIEEYYKQLFGREERGSLRLDRVLGNRGLFVCR